MFTPQFSMFTPHGLPTPNVKRANWSPIILTVQKLRQAAKRLSNINIEKVDCRARINRHTPGWNALQTMRAPGNGLANVQEPWHAHLLRNNPGPEKDVRNFRAVPLNKPEAPFTLNKFESQVESEVVVSDSRSRGGKAQEAVHKNNGAHNKRAQKAHRPADSETRSSVAFTACCA